MDAGTAWTSWLPAAGASLVAALFAAACWSRARGETATPLVIWGLALVQFAAAAAALSWGVAAGWSAGVYRAYYLLGAVTNVVWLGLGTVWLLARRPWALAATVGVVGATVYALALVVTSPLLGSAHAELSTHAVPSASFVFPGGVRALSRWFSIAGSCVVLGGLVHSSLRRSQRTGGLLLIGAGIVVVGLSSELARLGWVAPFAAGLAAGVSLMFVGFRRSGV